MEASATGKYFIGLCLPVRAGSLFICCQGRVNWGRSQLIRQDVAFNALPWTTGFLYITAGHGERSESVREYVTYVKYSLTGRDQSYANWAFDCEMSPNVTVLMEWGCFVLWAVKSTPLGLPYTADKLHSISV